MPDQGAARRVCKQDKTRVTCGNCSVDGLSQGGERRDVTQDARAVLGSIAFLIVLGVLVKFAFPTLKKTMSDRTEKIRSDLNGAASAKAQAEGESSPATGRGSPTRATEGQELIEAAGRMRSTSAPTSSPARRGRRDQGPRHPDDIRLADGPGGPPVVGQGPLDRAGRESDRGATSTPRPRRALIDSCIESGREQLRSAAIESGPSSRRSSRSPGGRSSLRDGGRALPLRPHLQVPSDELRLRITDPQLPTVRKVGVIEDLLSHEALASR